jgi:hypothetical protein
MIDDASAIIIQAIAFAAAKMLHKEESSVSSRAGRITEGHVQRSVHEVYRCLGDSYFQRAYRMSNELFWNLHTKLATRINRARLAMRCYVPKGGQKGGKFKLPPIRNGCITTSVCLACALRYFAGGSANDLMGTYGISHTDIMDSVWHVVEVVNNYPQFQITYPSSFGEQEKIVLYQVIYLVLYCWVY